VTTASDERARTIKVYCRSVNFLSEKIRKKRENGGKNQEEWGMLKN